MKKRLSISYNPRCAEFLFRAMGLFFVAMLLPHWGKAQTNFNQQPGSIYSVANIKALTLNEIALLDSLKPQNAEIASPEKSNATQKTHEHSPKTATILALALPGAGQFYNHKYWKVPVVYGAMGYTTYKMLQNRSKMRVLNDSISGLYLAGKSPSAQLIAQRDKFRGNRDVAILLMAGIYVLQAVDATVDAHFYKFNINDDIAILAKPNPTSLIAMRWELK